MDPPLTAAVEDGINDDWLGEFLRLEYFDPEEKATEKQRCSGQRMEEIQNAPIQEDGTGWGLMSPYKIPENLEVSENGQGGSMWSETAMDVFLTSSDATCSMNEVFETSSVGVCGDETDQEYYSESQCVGQAASLPPLVQYHNPREEANADQVYPTPEASMPDQMPNSAKAVNAVQLYTQRGFPLGIDDDSLGFRDNTTPVYTPPRVNIRSAMPDNNLMEGIAAVHADYPLLSNNEGSSPYFHHGTDALETGNRQPVNGGSSLLETSPNDNYEWIGERSLIYDDQSMLSSVADCDDITPASEAVTGTFSSSGQDMYCTKMGQPHKASRYARRFIPICNRGAFNASNAGEHQFATYENQFVSGPSEGGKNGTIFGEYWGFWPAQDARDATGHALDSKSSFTDEVVVGPIAGVFGGIGEPYSTRWRMSQSSLALGSPVTSCQVDQRRSTDVLDRNVPRKRYVPSQPATQTLLSVGTPKILSAFGDIQRGPKAFDIPSIYQSSSPQKPVSTTGPGKAKSPTSRFSATGARREPTLAVSKGSLPEKAEPFTGPGKAKSPASRFPTTGARHKPILNEAEGPVNASTLGAKVSQGNGSNVVTPTSSTCHWFEDISSSDAHDDPLMRRGPTKMGQLSDTNERSSRFQRGAQQQGIEHVLPEPSESVNLSRENFQRRASRARTEYQAWLHIKYELLLAWLGHKEGKFSDFLADHVQSLLGSKSSFRSGTVTSAPIHPAFKLRVLEEDFIWELRQMNFDASMENTIEDPSNWLRKHDEEDLFDRYLVSSELDSECVVPMDHQENPRRIVEWNGGRMYTLRAEEGRAVEAVFLSKIHNLVDVTCNVQVESCSAFLEDSPSFPSPLAFLPRNSSWASAEQGRREIHLGASASSPPKHPDPDQIFLQDPFGR